MKRKKLIILLLLALVIGAYLFHTVVRWHYETINSNIERYPEEFDSYDGKYTLQTFVEEGKEGSSPIHYVNILIVDNTTGKEALSIEKVYRVFDFHWAMWETDSYNFWLKSGDIGTSYYEYQEDGVWEKNELTEYPYEDIIGRLPDRFRLQMTGHTLSGAIK